MNLKIRKSSIVMGLLLFPFIQQRSYTEFSQNLYFFYRYTSILASIIMLYLCRKHSGFLKKNRGVRLIAVFAAIYIFSTLIHCPENLFYVTYHMLCYVALFSYVLLEMQIKPAQTLNVLSAIYGFYIYANFILWVLFPRGLYHVDSYHSANLLGDDNAIIYVALPGLICMFCNSLMQKEKITKSVWLAALCTEFMLMRIFSVSAMLVLLMFMVLVAYTLHVGRFNPRLLFISTLLVILLVFIGANSSFIQNVLLPRFGKSGTFNSRVFFWGKAAEMIRQKPILGWGGYFQMGSWKINEYAKISYPSHTPYLQIMIDGGLLVMFYFIRLLYSAYKSVSKKQKVLAASVLTIGMTCMLINYITEQSEFYHLLLIAAITLSIGQAGLAASTAETNITGEKVLQ